MTFDQAFQLVLGHEGRFSDHKDDPGGKTMWGITERVARAAGYDGEMQDMPVDVAKTIYARDYWNACRCESFAPEVRFHLFDASVNSGVLQATKWLQRALNVEDDGIIGKITLMAGKNQPGAVTAMRMTGYRLQFMSSLSTWSVFGRGWANRIAKNLIGAP